jgi:hypothetical protein
MTSDFRDLEFPLAGINRDRAFGEDTPITLPDGRFVWTTIEAKNVRAFEPSSLRSRGGSRPALIQHATVRPANGVCQCLEEIVFIEPS